MLRTAPLGSFLLVVSGEVLMALADRQLVLVHKDVIIESKEQLIDDMKSTIQDLRTKLDELKEEYRRVTNSAYLGSVPYWVDPAAVTLPIATEEELKGNLIRGKTVFVSWIPPARDRTAGIGPANFTIQKKTFENCNLIGPATLAILGDSVMERCSFATPSGASLNSMLLLAQDRYMFGVVPFDSCGFIECKFMNLSFAGNAESLAILKRGIKAAENSPPK